MHFISALKEYPGDAWIKKYIFPGGVVPSLREIMYIAGDKRFYTVGLESLRRHYNHTLLYWNKNFQESSSDHKKWQVQIFQYQFHLDHCLCTTFMRLLSNSCGGIL